MEIKKVKNGWEYDGLTFKTKKDAIDCLNETKQDSSIPLDLANVGKKKLKTIYDSSNPTSFGKFVSDFIVKTRGTMTIQSLANDIGVSKQAFYGWISGETLPKRKYISQIYKVMDCSQTELKKALKTTFDRQEQVLLEK